MPRTINEQDFTTKRNQILDATLRLIYTVGYERMAIQDILDELGISKGAFYHYFDSKPALLEAVIDRQQGEVLRLLEPIVHDPQLSAIEKLHRYFDTGSHWKSARKPLIIDILQVWHSDQNAIVRQKIWTNLSKGAMPLIVEILDQGVREGCFDIPYPDQIGAIFLSLIQALGDEFAVLLLAPIPYSDEFERAERMVAAYDIALQRLLGAPVGSIELMDAAALREWFGSDAAADAKASGVVAIADGERGA